MHHRARQVLDEDKRPIPETLVEICRPMLAWPLRAHHRSGHPAPLDPNFTARAAPSRTKITYNYITVKPGAYPWA